MNKKIFILALLSIIILTIPLTLILTRRRQEIRSRASASTTLSFTPVSTVSAPIRKNIGDTVSLDIMVNPGSNLVTFVRFQVQYDPTKLVPANTNAFVPNTNAFPLTIEGPIITSNTLAASLSVGSDPTKALQTTTRLAALNFRAIGKTNEAPTEITYTSLTQVLSSASTDQARENVLSTTTPVYITVNGLSPTISAIPTGILPTSILTIVPTTSITPITTTPIQTPTPGPSITSTSLKFDLLLHGVGAAGDNPNPDSSLSNKNPLHPQRNLEVVIIDSKNQPLNTISGSLAYTNDGHFKGTIDLGANFPTGDYTLKVKSDRYLRKLIPGIIHINAEKNNSIPQINLVAGDVKSDNILNVLDYNILLDCGYGAINPLPMVDPDAAYNSPNCKAHEPFRSNSDLEDNGFINSADYNLFIRELSVQSGD